MINVWGTPSTPPFSIWPKTFGIIISTGSLSGQRMLLSSIMRIQYLSNQSWSFWIKQQTDFDHISTITGHTEDKFPPCISFLYKMCFPGHSFPRSVQILACLVFTDKFSLPALSGPATFSSCLDSIVWFIPQFDFIFDLIALSLAPALLFCYFFLTSLLFDLS